MLTHPQIGVRWQHDNYSRVALMYIPFIPTYIVTLTIKRAETSPLAMCEGAMKIRSIFGAGLPVGGRSGLR